MWCQCSGYVTWFQHLVSRVGYLFYARATNQITRFNSSKARAAEQKYI